MSTKANIVTAAAVVALGVGATTVLTPRTAAEQIQQSVEQDSTSTEKQQEDLRHKSADEAEAERLRRLIPGEYRPKVPGVRIWWP